MPVSYLQILFLYTIIHAKCVLHSKSLKYLRIFSEAAFFSSRWSALTFPLHLTPNLYCASYDLRYIVNLLQQTKTNYCLVNLSIVPPFLSCLKLLRSFFPFFQLKLVKCQGLIEFSFIEAFVHITQKCHHKNSLCCVSFFHKFYNTFLLTL